MKQVFVCGDSFGSTDPDYKITSWTEQLAEQLQATHTLVNLSKVCASNLHIALQVDAAIERGADYIIYLATSSTRFDVELHSNQTSSRLVDRFVDITDLHSAGDLTSYSSASLDHTTRFSNSQLKLLKEYHSHFSNLDLAIYTSKTIIEAVLNRLKYSGIPFKFDQGGFEHPSFGGNHQYFKTFSSNRSSINIWDYVVGEPLAYRPYHHITDPAVHNLIAEYYFKQINDIQA
jgi:hypothetical protein